MKQTTTFIQRAAMAMLRNTRTRLALSLLLTLSCASVWADGYTLEGRGTGRAGALRPGVYIHNGKKMVMK